MELRIYDTNLDFVGLTENQESFLWNIKYNEVGSFELHIPITEYNLDLFKIDRLISFRNTKKAGVIEAVRLFQTDFENKMIVDGRMLETYLDRHIIKENYYFNGRAKDSIYTLIERYGKFKNFKIDKNFDDDTNVTFVADHKNLGSVVRSVCKACNYGYTIDTDFTNKVMTFRLFKGMEKTKRQKERNFVAFNDEYGNITKASNEINTQLYRNVAYVYSSNSNTKVEVGETSETGINRREVFVDGNGIDKDKMSAYEYLNALKSLGYEALKQNSIADSFSCDADPYGNFKYKDDYNIGDVVTVGKRVWSVDKDLRITEITEVYEHGIMKVQLTFGTPLPSTLEI